MGLEQVIYSTVLLVGAWVVRANFMSLYVLHTTSCSGTSRVNCSPAQAQVGRGLIHCSIF